MIVDQRIIPDILTNLAIAMIIDIMLDNRGKYQVKH